MPNHDSQPASRVCFDADLIRRYDRNGPRYTSYPTAVEFHPGCTSAQYREVAARSNQPAGKPLFDSTRIVEQLRLGGGNSTFLQQKGLE